MGNILEAAKSILENIVEPRRWRIEQRGNQTTHAGQFCVYDRAGTLRTTVWGTIAETDVCKVDVYIYDPPAFVRRHQHSSCLQLLTPSDKWFKLHFEKPAPDFARARDYVEQFLSEAYQDR